MKIYQLVVLLLFQDGQSIQLDDIIFPPNYDSDFQPMHGHLKPFGFQRKPDGPIKEYNSVLAAPEFYKSHAKNGVPLVYRGAIRKSPAMKLWNDRYLSEKFGHLDVLVELKSEDRSHTTGRMRFGRFLNEYQEKQIYIVSLLPSEMMKDVQVRFMSLMMMYK